MRMIARLLCTAAALTLVACAPLTPRPAPAEKRYTAAELLALQPGDFQWPGTSQAGERALREAALADIRARLALPAGPERDAALPGLWDRVLQYNLEMDATRALLREVLPTLGTRDAEFQRAALTAAHALMLDEPVPWVAPLLPQLQASKPFAIAAYLWLRAEPAVAAPALRERIPQQFPQWADDARLTAVMQRLAEPPALPPLADVLTAPLQPGVPVLFSLQRPGRMAMGRVLLRGADGRFVRTPDGALFSQPQLALSRSGLPGTITNGNTPQGLFSVTGAGTATNPNIGPVPYLHTQLPVEASPAVFLHGDAAAPPAWTQALYDSLLPPGWRGHPALREAWWAGRAGRDELLVHGTTLNPADHAGQPYHPGTPQQGCLISNEDWDPATGQLRASLQLNLLKAYAAASRREDLSGFLWVLEVPGDGPVTAAEVQAWVNAAER